MLKCKECKLEGRREGRKEALIRLLLTHYSSGLLMVVRSSGQVACPAQPPLKAAFKAQLGSTDGWMKHEVLYYSSTSFTSTWLYRFEKEEKKSFPSACPPLLYSTCIHWLNGLGLSSTSQLFCFNVHQCRLRLRWRFGRSEYFVSGQCREPEVLSSQVWIELFYMLSFYLHVG